MEFLKQWSFCVCLTLIISVIFSILSPKGEMKRFYKIMISIFVFISFIYPFKDFNSSDLRIESGDAIFEINDVSDKSYENVINRRIKDFLKEKGISANVDSKVSFDIENNQIEIKEVTIYIADEYSKEQVNKLVFDEMGINSKVVNIGE